MSWEQVHPTITIASEIGGLITLVLLAFSAFSALRRAVAALRKQKEDFEAFLDLLKESTGTVAERSDLGLYLMNMINGLTSIRDVSLFFSLLFAVVGSGCLVVHLFAITFSKDGYIDEIMACGFCISWAVTLGMMAIALIGEHRASIARIRFGQMWADVLVKHKLRRKS